MEEKTAEGGTGEHGCFFCTMLPLIERRWLPVCSTRLCLRTVSTKTRPSRIVSVSGFSV